MNVETIIQSLKNIQKGKPKPRAIRDLEDQLLNHIEVAVLSHSFYELPLHNILSITSRMDFTSFDEPLSLIEKIITNTLQIHKGPNTLMLLSSINVVDLSLSTNDYMRLLSFFQCSSFLTGLTSQFYENEQIVEFDTEYSLNENQMEINRLKQRLNKIMEKEFPPIEEQPEDFENNIFLAAYQGKLSSIQYHIEVLKTNPEIALLEKLFIDRNNVLNIGDTPLHIACRFGYLKIAHYLLDKICVNVDITDKNGFTPLHKACMYNQFNIAKFLIEEHDANLEIGEGLNGTPLYKACWKGNIQIIRYLVEERGANINCRTKSGRTCLHRASETGQLEVIQYLLEKGVDKSIRNSGGQLPYDVICKHMNSPDPSLVEQLKELLKL